MTIDRQSFKFKVPASSDDQSDQAHAVLVFAALAERLALEDRTMCTHITGRRENVAEHSFMLAVLAPAMAGQFYPELDANLVARFAAIHDAVEAYVGDTPTHNIDEAGLSDKQILEQQGLEQLRLEFAAFPSFVRIVDQYEAQQVPEARFVRVLDKFLPLAMHFLEDGKTLTVHITRDELLQNAAERAAALKAQYPEFAGLIDVRTELADLAAKRFYV